MQDAHSKLIDDLGGEDALASKIAAIAVESPNREAIRKWRRNDVPWRWRAVVAKIARRHRVRLPDGFEGVPERQQDAA